MPDKYTMIQQYEENSNLMEAYKWEEKRKLLLNISYQASIGITKSVV